MTWKVLSDEISKAITDGVQDPKDIHRWIAKADELLNSTTDLTKDQQNLLTWLQTNER